MHVPSLACSFAFSKLVSNLKMRFFFTMARAEGVRSVSGPTDQLSYFRTCCDKGSSQIVLGWAWDESILNKDYNKYCKGARTAHLLHQQCH